MEVQKVKLTFNNEERPAQRLETNKMEGTDGIPVELSEGNNDFFKFSNREEKIKNMFCSIYNKTDKS